MIENVIGYYYNESYAFNNPKIQEYETNQENKRKGDNITNISSKTGENSKSSCKRKLIFGRHDHSNIIRDEYDSDDDFMRDGFREIKEVEIGINNNNSHKRKICSEIDEDLIDDNALINEDLHDINVDFNRRKLQKIKDHILYSK